jgi:hypothetical protein
MGQLKNIFLILMILILIPANSLKAQTTLYDIPITANYKNQPLKEVLNDLSKKTNTRFSYSPDKIPEQKIITASFSGTSLNKALDEILINLPIKYELIDNYIILKRGPVNEPVSINKPATRYTLSGYIKDTRTGEFLLGATIYIKELNAGTITNNYGYFSITTPPGRYSLTISFIGYDDIVSELNMVSNMKVDFKMIDRPQKLEEVIISSIRKEELNFKLRASQSEMVPSVIAQQPSLMGEADVIKSLAMQTGISFIGDGSCYFSVRGGNYDQNLILLDEATIFNPSHLLGIFSPIIPDAVQSVDIYKADFPINYGGRLSSVVDIRTRDGNKNNFAASGSLGLISFKTTAEGPFKKEASSFFLSFRRSYFDAFLKQSQPNLINLYFNDYTIKLNYKIRHRDRIYFTFYRGKDVFKNKTGNDTTGLDWGNTSGTLRWNHVFGSKFFSNTTIFVSKYEYTLHNSFKNDTYWSSYITNGGLKHDLSFYITPRMTWRFGLKIGFYDFNPGNYYTPQTADQYQVSPVKSVEGTLYAGSEHKIADWLKINYGIRLVTWKDQGKADIVYYNKNHIPDSIVSYKKDEVFFKDRRLEPRLSLSIRTGKLSSLKAGYSRTTQYLNLITNSISPFNSLEVWMPASPTIKPQYADIIDLGFIGSSKNSKYTLQTDVFYKWLNNQIAYKYHAEMLINQYIEGEIRQGNGWAYGFEVSLAKEGRKLSGQMGYTYSRSFIKVNEINEGEYFPASTDRPHNFNINILFQARPRWQLSGNYLISSGSPVTTPTSFYYYRGYQVPVYSKQNNDRLPTYQRFDFSTTFKLSKASRRYQHNLTLAVFNMLGQQNPIFVYFNKTKTDDDKLMVPADRLNNPELTPSVRYTYWIIPSLTYNFNF